MLKNKQTDPATREFIQKRIQSARWLIESIEQRRNTLLKVARAIIEHQKDFLDKGPESIEPLKMQQIADRVHVHVTTVSRAVDDKWVQTPRGIFPLKRFFGGGTTTADGEEVAWDTIKQKLLEIIAKEDKQNPLSDEEIVEELGRQGFPVARRTVTKYRQNPADPVEPPAQAVLSAIGASFTQRWAAGCASCAGQSGGRLRPSSLRGARLRRDGPTRRLISVGDSARRRAGAGRDGDGRGRERRRGPQLAGGVLVDLDDRLGVEQAAHRHLVAEEADDLEDGHDLRRRRSSCVRSSTLRSSGDSGSPTGWRPCPATRRRGSRARRPRPCASRKAFSSPGRDLPARIREISESLTWDSFASFWPLRLWRAIRIWSFSSSLHDSTIAHLPDAGNDVSRILQEYPGDDPRDRP